jgi:hypothetical protein
MLVGYLDEAGNIGVYDPADPSSTPVFILAGFSVREDAADDLLMEYVRLKLRFEPSLRSRQLSEVIQYEVKGANLRRDLRNPTSRDTRRRAVAYLHHILVLLERYHCRIFGRILVKHAGEMYPASSTYPSAVAELAATFDHQAQTEHTRGLMILDAQTKVKNEGNVHTITTRRYRRGGSGYRAWSSHPCSGTVTLMFCCNWPTCSPPHLSIHALSPHICRSLQAMRTWTRRTRSFGGRSGNA